jgi:NADH-quinone oxidoreductase subunit E
MIQFSQSAKDKVEALKRVYPTKDACLLPVLYIAQKEFGYISPEVMEYVAGVIGVSPARVYGVATFYTMYNKKPVGKYHVQACTNISCHLEGSAKIVDTLKSVLGIEEGQTTKDNMFTLSTVECLGACGFGPVVQINDDYYEQCTEQKIKEIIEGLRKK